jgi:hypothetical protein
MHEQCYKITNRGFPLSLGVPKGDVGFVLGNPRAVGSLSNLRLQIEQLSVDQKGSNSATGDEFLLHVFMGHVIAAICEHFGIKSIDNAIEHKPTKEWLESTAQSIVSKPIFPVESDDHVYALHSSILHACSFFILI